MNSSEDEEERRSDWWKHWVMFYLFAVAVMYGYQVQVGRHTGIGSSFGVSRFAPGLLFPGGIVRIAVHTNLAGMIGGMIGELQRRK